MEKNDNKTHLQLRQEEDEAITRYMIEEIENTLRIILQTIEGLKKLRGWK